MYLLYSIITCFSLFHTGIFAVRLDADFISILNPFPYSKQQEQMQQENKQKMNAFRMESNESIPFTAPQGWMQGLQYTNTGCAGTSFLTTNIATGVCIKNGDNSSYMQYVLLLPDAVPTVYIFYIADFSDPDCIQMVSDAMLGSLDPTLVCLPDNGGTYSKTVYYYPGTNPPLYPYNGVFTTYLLGDTNCTDGTGGTVVKTVISNPDTCFTNYNYNASDPEYSFQSYTTTCNTEFPIINTMYSDAGCTVPANTTWYLDNMCQWAIHYRERGFPELYMVVDPYQYFYQTVISSCYLGPPTFLQRVMALQMYMSRTLYTWLYAAVKEGVYNGIL